MKALIWIGCMIASIAAMLVVDIILFPFGIRQGYLLRMIYISAGAFIARRICRKNFRKFVEKKLAKEGLTPAEYIRKKVPQKHLEMCEFYRGKNSELDSYLRTLVKDERIPKDAYAILMEMYGEQ